MNAIPGTPEIDAFTAYELGGKAVIDATATVGGTFHGFGHYTPEKAHKIDYIFTTLPCDTSKSYVVKDIPVDGLYISDHNPVCAYIDLP
jgi:endonuclease/exonuclease/phosphatase family metal-dependent hydrolase